jgi:predicted O-methyltransferase YrrM
MLRPLKILSRNLRAPMHRRQAFRLLDELHAQTPSLDALVARGMKLGSNGWYRVRSLQIPSEIIALARAVEALQPKIILEIGTARGGTALIWAHVARERLITCDILDRRGFADLLRAFPPPGSACEVSVMVGDSHDPAFVERVGDELGGERADFLFIDGDHSETGVERDFENYRKFVRPGGLIGFHDIADDQPLPTNQVQYFWKRIRNDYETMEFIQDRGQCGFGIGVIRMPGGSQAA